MSIAIRRSGWVLLVVFLLFTALLQILPAWAQNKTPRTSDEAAQLAVVSPTLQNQLDSTSGPVAFLAILREQSDANAVIATANVQAAEHKTKATILYAHLTAQAQRSQAPLRAWLQAQGIRYRAFYIVNMLEIYGDATVVAQLRQRPEVDRLVADPLIQQGLQSQNSASHWQRMNDSSLPQMPLQSTIPAAIPQPYGLSYTHAVDVWALGYRGQGIVVGSQDTGVDFDHPALKLAYRGYLSSTQTVTHTYNWFDAWGAQGRPAWCSTDPAVPCDDYGHGSHTVGTMLGDATPDGGPLLGMAPAAQWIGCRNMNQGVGKPSSYTACFEFFLAPYPQGGDPMTEGQPELAPDVINNSWGCPPMEGCDVASLRQIVETMRAAGIMVVASAGNKGTQCNIQNNQPISLAVHDPIAIYDAVFSVGAHDSSGTIASFSSRGPVDIDGSGRRKPDISAPGVGVYSTWVRGDPNRGDYDAISGTSMASPHVVGAIALLWSAVPTLTGRIDATEQVLIKSATPVLFRNNECGGAADLVSPNNSYGYGRLNVLAAVQLANQPGSLTLAISETLSISTVTVIDNQTGYRYTQPVVNHGVQFPLLYATDYTVEGLFGSNSITNTFFSRVTAQLNESKRLAIPAHSYYFPLVANN